MKEKLVLFYEKHKLWIYPLKYIFVAVIISVLTIMADMGTININRYIPTLFLTSPGLAQTILSTLVSSILAITTFTFSTTMVVLTMYSSQFSPRVVQNFLSEKTTLKVLGIFMGGFLYSVTTLLFMRKSDDGQLVIASAIGVLYAIVCLIYFAVFIFKVSSSIQVHNLLGRLYREAQNSIDEAVKKHSGNIHPADISREYRNEYLIKSGLNGYVKGIDYSRILDICSAEHSLISIEIKIGEFIVRGKPVIRLYTDTDLDEEEVEKLEKKMLEYIVIDLNRSVSYDYMFALKKIVDIALRAISPGINDPNTAIESINILGVLLSRLSKYEGNCISLKDDESDTKIVYRYFDFEENLYEVFYQIIIYGKSDLSVVLSILKALENITYYADGSNLRYVEEFRTYVYEKTAPEFDNETDRSKINRLMRK